MHTSQKMLPAEQALRLLPRKLFHLSAKYTARRLHENPQFIQMFSQISCHSWHFRNKSLSFILLCVSGDVSGGVSAKISWHASRQLSQTTLKQIPPVCHRDSRPERPFSKIIHGFAAMCTSFPYDKKVFPCKIKIKPRELIYLLYGQKRTRRGKWITICKRNRKEQKKIRILVPRKGTKKEALLTRCLFLHEKKSFMNASLFVPSSTCPSSPSFQEQEQKLSFLHSICSIQR